MSSKSSKTIQGFTLAELLIALAILGVIATFTIPKILAGSSESQNKALFKETISAINEVVYDGVMSNELYSGMTGYPDDYVIDRINAIQVCMTDAEAEGCWDIASGDHGAENHESGFVLATGATVTGIAANNNGTLGADRFIMDINGAEGPNTIGEDVIRLEFCYDQTGSLWGSTSCRAEGTVVGRSLPAANVTLWRSLWQ